MILFDPSDNSRFYEGHLLEAKLRYANRTFYRDRLMKSTAMTMSPVDITKPNFEVSFTLDLSSSCFLVDLGFYFAEVSKDEECRSDAVHDR